MGDIKYLNCHAQMIYELRATLLTSWWPLQPLLSSFEEPKNHISLLQLIDAILDLYSSMTAKIKDGDKDMLFASEIMGK